MLKADCSSPVDAGSCLVDAVLIDEDSSLENQGLGLLPALDQAALQQQSVDSLFGGQAF